MTATHPEATTIASTSGSGSPKNEGPSLPKSVAGFLLLDCDLRPVSFNAEALQVLAYPEVVGNVANPELFLKEKIHAILATEPTPGEFSFLTEFHSGRRRYVCRAFTIDSRTGDPSRPCVAVLLERGPSGWVSLPQVARQFNLTEREGEVLGYLLQGMSNKEIANRMKLSANTVKAFLRLIMIKTGASSRSMIMARIIMSTPARETP
jgi:DNA-binding CsgD family transcriptional regulator